MNNILLLYRSKYGATAKYAAMLEQTVPCDIFELDKYDISKASAYDLIIFAGGIYASGVSCMKYLRRNIRILTGKNIAVFAVGASPFEKDAFAAVKEHNLKNLPSGIPMFYGRGIYDESIMTLKDRTLCKMLKKSLSKRDPSTFEPWMKALFEADGKSNDWTDKKYLEPLLKYIRECVPGSAP